MDRSARGDRRPRREPAFPLLDRRGRPPVPAGLQDRRRPGPGGRVRARQRLGAPGQQHAAAVPGLHHRGEELERTPGGGGAGRHRGGPRSPAPGPVPAAEGVLRAHAADRAAAPVGVEGVLRVPDLGTRPVVPDAGAAADDLGRPARGTAGGGAGSGVPGSGGVRRVELGHRRRPNRPVLHADRRRLGPVRQHQGAAADPVAARPAARHSAAHSRTIQTTNTPTPKREERPSGVDPSRLKTDPSRNTRATIRPAMPNHRHSSPVRNPAREIVAASAETALIGVADTNEPAAVLALFQLQGRVPVIFAVTALAATISLAGLRTVLLWRWLGIAGLIVALVFLLGSVFSLLGSTPEGRSSLFGVGVFVVWMVLLCAALWRAAGRAATGSAAAP